MDDINQAPHNQRSLLQIQEINRKGRISPLPQAVQGAQPQLSGPAGEPGIKSEFGRIFAGISGGIGGISSPAPTRTALPFSGPGMLRRDDADVPQPESGPEPPAKPSARGKRSRKPKDDDGNGEDSGRASPAARNKRAKNHAHHHHQYVELDPSGYIPLTNRPSHHHHHHHHAQEQLSAAGTANLPSKNAVPSPTGGFVKDVHPSLHHHVAPRSTPGSHAQTKAVAPAPQPMIIPKPKRIVAGNQAVLDEVAHLPRNHLGDVPYEVRLEPARLQDPRTGRPPRHGYKSTPVPLPSKLIEDNLNCTLTVKVGKQHLVREAREEITSRRALWGTDIYTDDSDIVAACIHGGWIRGEWPEEVDVDMLDLYTADDKDKKGKRATGAAAKLAAQAANNMVVLDAPPKGGPQNVPENQDLHVTVLILPRLEKYASSCRFGIKSREFGGEVLDVSGLPHRTRHDGLSFMVMGLRWVSNGAGTQNRLRGKARRERIRRALREVELGPVWAARSLNVDGGRAAELVEKAATPIDGDVEMRGNWWKHRATPGSEGDKENAPATGSAADKPVAAAAKQTGPEQGKAAADTPVVDTAQAELEGSPTAKEDDPDETMGDDTVVEEGEKDEAKTEEVTEPEKVEQSAEAEEPTKASPPEVTEEAQRQETLNSENAAETTSKPAEQTGQDEAGPGKEAGEQPPEKADTPTVAALETAQPAVGLSKDAFTAVAAETPKEPLAEASKETPGESVQPTEGTPEKSIEEPIKEPVKEPATEADPTAST